VHERFGLAADQLRFFSQGTVPSLDDDGRALLAGPGRLLENPDGHGGCFTALVASGALARLDAEGIAQLVSIQVDNLLAPVDDPLLVGLAEAEAADAVTKVLGKAHPDEKVGHLVRVDGRDRIVEYTELDADQTRLIGSDGQPLFRWGSPAMHCWRVGVLVALAARGFRPPLHRSRKPLRAWSDGGLRDVRGWKSERFIFDLIPEAERSIGLEIERAVEFAPVKNVDGADSPATARRLASDCWAGWLRRAGCSVDLGGQQFIEISPLFAATEAELRERWQGRSTAVTGDFYLEEPR
jgi:UDP-N-acetylglucosamine/UDP-N-acetylgalactosamine diphosphorylase